MNWVFQQGWPGPRILLAHSLGAAAALEALRRPGALRPDRIIFCSPLLRTSWYPALWLTDQMMGWLLVPVSETFGWNDNAATIHWFHVLGTWLAKLDLQKPLDLPLVVYSGDRDSVVDKSWDQSKYEELIPGVQWVTLPGKGHWFISDSLERQAFHERLWADLEREAPIPPLAQE
jgi:pimeloyl-ACP methyl ester carboxylesterase